MCVCVCVCVCACMYICTHTHGVCVCVCVCMYVYSHTHTHVCVCVCLCVCMCVCVKTHVYVYTAQEGSHRTKLVHRRSLISWRKCEEFSMSNCLVCTCVCVCVCSVCAYVECVSVKPQTPPQILFLLQVQSRRSRMTYVPRSLRCERVYVFVGGVFMCE